MSNTGVESFRVGIAAGDGRSADRRRIVAAQTCGVTRLRRWIGRTERSSAAPGCKRREIAADVEGDGPSQFRTLSPGCRPEERRRVSQGAPKPLGTSTGRGASDHVDLCSGSRLLVESPELRRPVVFLFGQHLPEDEKVGSAQPDRDRREWGLAPDFTRLPQQRGQRDLKAAKGSGDRITAAPRFQVPEWKGTGCTGNPRSIRVRRWEPGGIALLKQECQ